MFISYISRKGGIILVGLYTANCLTPSDIGHHCALMMVSCCWRDNVALHLTTPSRHTSQQCPLLLLLSARWVSTLSRCDNTSHDRSAIVSSVVDFNLHSNQWTLTCLLNNPGFLWNQKVSRSVQEPAIGSLTSISVVSFHLLLGLPSGLFL
jgi:hypothetical protein